MTAAHPTQPTVAAGDQRSQEPSMEEILASIRRIIADDQSLPGHGAFRETAGLRGPVEEPSPTAEKPPHAPVHILHPEPAIPPREVLSGAAPAPVAPQDEPAVDALTQAHGSIAAPQFATPAGPVGIAAAPEPAAEAEPLPAPHVAALPDPVAFEPPHSAPSPEPAHPVASARPEPEFEPESFEYDEPIGHEMPAATQDVAPALFSTATDHSVTSAFNMLAATRLADNSEELLAMTREMIRPILKAWLDDNLPSMVERLVRAEIERVSRGGR